MTRALVLGGGGLTGIAWEAGVLEGLSTAGVDVRSWDLVVGTSAGAFVGARLLAEGSPATLLREQLSLDAALTGRQLRALTGRSVSGLVTLSRHRGAGWVQSAGIVPIALGALVGASVAGRAGRRSGLIGSPQRPDSPQRPAGTGVRAMGWLAGGVRGSETAWVEWWATRLGLDDWPRTRLVVTTLDIADGRRRTIDRSAGIPIARAIAASTALAGLVPPVQLDGHRYMDGGTSSPTNADLAIGATEILVIAPVDRGGLAAEVLALEAAAASVRVIRPGPASAAVLGRDLGRLDPARVADSARAGLVDGEQTQAPGRSGIAT